MNLDALVRYYETLTPESVEAMGRFYAADCRFKDPFNDVRGIDAVQEIFRRMFRQLANPRFVVTARYAGDGGAALVWEFEFRIRSWRPCVGRRIRGMTLLQFDAAGLVVDHRDYWDAAEELYEQLPVLGAAMRWLKRRMR